MNNSPVIKAPFVVQSYRVFFVACAFYFGSFVWRERHIGSFAGLLELQGFTFFSLLGFVYTRVRARRSRWIVAILGILIPAVVYIGMCLMIFSRPEAWWDWLLCGLVTAALFALPVTFAVALFRDKKTDEYFTKSAA
jgi:hypothetical protein